MRKLFIVFDDNSKITYTIKDSVGWKKYWERHKYMKALMKSAILQQYPKKKYEPVNLLENESEDK